MSRELHSITSEPSQVIRAFENISKSFNEKANSTDPLTEDEAKMVALVEPICDDLEKYITFLRNEATVTLNNGAPLMPSYLLLSKAGMACPIILPQMPDTREDVAILMACLTATLNSAPIDAYSFMSEVYMAENTPETDKELAEQAPSKRSDRKEGVVIRVANRFGTRIAIFDINTEEDGTKVIGTENKVPPDASEMTPNVLMRNLFEIASTAKDIVEKQILAKEDATEPVKRTLH